jgi:hypothetical protein
MLAAREGETAHEEAAEREVAPLPTLREDEGAPGGEGAPDGMGACAADLDSTDDEEQYASDFDSEDEAAATLRATLRASLRLQATLRGGKEAAAALSPVLGGVTVVTRAGGAEGAAATAQAVLRVLEQRAAEEEASKANSVPTLSPSLNASQPVALAAGARGSRGSRHGGLLSNSLGSFAPPSGVLSKPDPSEIVEAVAFVLAKQIEEEGRVLLLRTLPPAEAEERAGEECARDAGSEQLSQGGTRLADQGRRSLEGSDATLAGGPGELRARTGGVTEVSTGHPGSGEGSSGGSGSSGTYSDDESEEVELPGSPPPSAGFCRALLRAQDALDGLRYSLELSPIVEARRRGGHASLHASLEVMSDAVTWAGAWRPPESLRCLFDEALHPLPFDMEGRALNGRPHPLAWSNPTVAQVSGFLKQIADRARMGAEASVVGLAYVERFVSVSGRPVDPRSWRRAVLAAWLLAAKMWDDDCYESHDFAEVMELDGAPRALRPRYTTPARIPHLIPPPGHLPPSTRSPHPPGSERPQQARGRFRQGRWVQPRSVASRVCALLLRAAVDDAALQGALPTAGA